MDDKTMPNDVQAELAVLSGLLMPSGDVIDDVIGGLFGECFWTRSHQILFSAILGMHQKSEKIDAITVCSKLKDMGKLEEVGGEYFVHKVACSNPLASHAMEYSEIVREKWRLRQIIEMTDEAHGKAYDNVASRDIASDLESKVFKLSQDSSPDINLMQTAVKELDEMLDSTQAIGVQTGIECFDRVTGGLLDGKYYALGGRVKQGKTALACQIALNLIMKDVPVLYVSLEMTQKDLLGRMASTLCEVEFSRAQRRVLTPTEKETFRSAYRKIQSKPLIMKMPASISAHEIRSEIRKAKRKHGIKVVVIDYIQKVRVEDRDMRTSIANASEAIRATCKETGVAAIVVCQLNREAEKERPRLGHLKESGAIEQDADVVCLIYATDKENDGYGPRNVTLAFDANRNGPECEEQILYDGKFLKFRNKTLQNKFQ